MCVCVLRVVVEGRVCIKQLDRMGRGRTQSEQMLPPHRTDGDQHPAWDKEKALQLQSSKNSVRDWACSCSSWNSRLIQLFEGQLDKIHFYFKTCGFQGLLTPLPQIYNRKENVNIHLRLQVYEGGVEDFSNSKTIGNKLHLQLDLVKINFDVAKAVIPTTCFICVLYLQFVFV